MIDSAKLSYDAWHARHADAEPPAAGLLHPWHRTVARRLPNVNGQKILEVGCGRGDFSLWLKRQFPDAEIVAVDFSDVAIDVARRRAAETDTHVTFGVEDAENLTLDANQFDWVISCECLEHVPHPPNMAAQISRVLKPQGRFLLTTENYFNGMVLAWLAAWSRGRAFDSGSSAQPHENFFLYWRVKRLLEEGGLTVDHMESNHFQWLLLPGCAPHRLCTEDFDNAVLKRLFRPFGRHFTFEGRKH